MKLILILLLVSSSVFAQTTQTQAEKALSAREVVKAPLGYPDGTRLYQKDSSGRTLYHLPSYTVKGGTIYETDNSGRILYHRPVVGMR